MKTLALLTLMLMCSMPDTLLQKEVERYLDRWNAAMVAADTSSLAAMMDEAIVLRHLSGATRSVAGLAVLCACLFC